VEPPEVPATPVETTARPSHQVPYVIGGVSAAALVNAGLFYLLRRSKASDLQDLCGADHNCTNADPRPLVGDEVSRSRDLDDKMRLYSTISGISAVAGLVGLGVAGVWFVTENKQQKSVTAWSIQPVAPGAQLGGLSVQHRF